MCVIRIYKKIYIFNTKKINECYEINIFFSVRAMAAATTLSSVLNSVASNASTVTTVSSSTVVQSSPSEPIFLQTKLAQGLAGTFVFAALFLTCQQVIR